MLPTNTITTLNVWIGRQSAFFPLGTYVCVKYLAYKARNFESGTQNVSELDMLKTETLFVKVIDSKNLSRRCYIFQGLNRLHIAMQPSWQVQKKGRGEKREREKAEAVPHPLSFCTSTPPATQDNHHKIQDLPVPNVSVPPILKCEWFWGKVVPCEDWR